MFLTNWLGWDNLTITQGCVIDALALLPILRLIWWCFITVNGPSIKYWLWQRFSGQPAIQLDSCGWTVITGCTDGIGRAYTLELTKRGTHMFMLIGRNAQKLARLVESIKQFRPDAKCETFVVDLAHPDWTEFKRTLQNRRVGLLVNCAGVSVPYAARFCEYNQQLAMDIINVNITATTYLIGLILPQMVERRSGAIVNFGSVMGYLPCSGSSANYGATKSYIKHLSESLAAEYSCLGIRIQCLTPAYVYTKMVRHVEHEDYWHVNADLYAHDAVNQLLYSSMICQAGTLAHELLIAFALHVWPNWAGGVEKLGLTAQYWAPGKSSKIQ